MRLKATYTVVAIVEQIGKLELLSDCSNSGRSFL